MVSRDPAEGSGRGPSESLLGSPIFIKPFVFSELDTSGCLNCLVGQCFDPLCAVRFWTFGQLARSSKHCVLV
jgi:hypothetical protein